MPLVLITWLITINIVTFAAYTVDRSRARHGRRRISDGALLVLGFCGGNPAAYFAQHALHHKLRNRTFQGQFGMTIVLQILLLAAVLIALELRDYSFYDFFHGSPSSLL